MHLRQWIPVLMFILVAPLLVSGAEYQGKDVIKISAADTLRDNLVGGARYVDIQGVVAGDLYVGARQITIDGSIEEDVIAGCQDFTLNGTIGDMLTIGAETVTIDGIVQGDVHAFGSDVRITQSGRIGGNLFVGSGTFRLEGGEVGGWIRGGSGGVTLDGKVGGVVDLEVGSIFFGNKYQAEEGTYISIDQSVERSEMGTVPEDITISYRQPERFFSSVYFYWSLLSMFIVGALFALIFRQLTSDVVRFAMEKVPAHLGIGAIWLLLTPVAVVTLFIFVVTIPVSLILLALYLIMLYLSSILSGFVIGEYVLEAAQQPTSKNRLILALAIGLIIIVLLPRLPWIGWLLNLGIICFGGGSMVAFLWSLKGENVQTEPVRPGE